MSVRPSVIGVFLAASALALDVGPARAQTNTADIAVRVVAPPGPRPAVAVRIDSTGGPLIDLTVSLDGAGDRARFPALPPGTYRVAVEAAGFAFASVETSVSAGDTVTLVATLAPSAAGGASRIEIGARHRLTPGALFDGNDLHGLPSSRDVWSLLETAEATAILDRIDGGGLFTGEPGRVGIHGSSWTQASFRLGDLDATDPDRGGTPLAAPDFAGLTAVNVATALLPVDIGPPGAVVALVPQRPGRAWQGSAGADFAGGGLQANAAAGPPAIARLGSWRHADVAAGGPLVKDRLGLLLSGTFTRVQRFEREDPAELTGQTVSLVAHLVYAPGLRDEVRFLGAAHERKHPFAGRVLFSGNDAIEDDRTLDFQSTWERRSANGAFWHVAGGYQRGTFDPPDGLPPPSEPVDRLEDGPVPELVFPGRGTRQRWDLAGAFAPPTWRFGLGWHSVRFGASIGRVTSLTRPAFPAGPVAERIGGLAARVWDYGYAGPESRWQATEAAAYVADRVRFGDRLEVEAGLRLETTDGSADGARGDVRWRSFAPRASARWMILDRDRLALFAGYARYRHRLPLATLAFGDPSAPQGNVYRWNDANGDGRFQPGERGVLVARVGPGAADSTLASIDPALKPPHTDEVVAGVEARFGETWTARFLAIHRRERDLMASVNVGVPPSAYTARLMPDPGGDLLGPADDQLLPIYDRRPETFGQDRYLLTNPPGENALHEGVELSLEKRFGSRLRLRLGATASRSIGDGANRGFRVGENDQGPLGERDEQANAATDSRGRLFFDRAFTIKIAGSYRAPADVLLGWCVRYQDGQPFARVVLVPDLAQGPDFAQAIPRGRSRFSYTLTVDARAEKGFAFGRRRLAVALEAFNLLNAASEVEEDVVSGPGFRAVTAVQPPRSLRLGLRLGY